MVIEDRDNPSVPRVVADQLKSNLNRAQQIFGSSSNDNLAKNRRKTVNPNARLAPKNAKIMHNISVTDNVPSIMQESTAIRSVSDYAENSKHKGNGMYGFKQYSQSNNASRMLKRKLLKSASVHKSSFIHNISQEDLSESEITNLIKNPSFFKEIKSEIKEGDKRLKMIKQGSMISTIDARSRVSQSTATTRKKRPKTAVQPRINRINKSVIKDPSEKETASIFYGTQSGFSIMKR